MARAAKVEKSKVEESTDLVLATEINPVVLFGKNNDDLKPLLTRIEKEVMSIVPDVTTAKGRKAITANVSRVTKSKTALEKAGKDHVAAQKEELKYFDSQRKLAKDFLEDLQKEARKPLTEWEDKEKDRIAKCENTINTFIEAGKDSENWMNYTEEELTDLLNTIIETTITKRLAEFEEEARIAKVDAIGKINNAISSRNKYDNEQKELAEMRKKMEKIDRANFEADQQAKAEKAAQQKIIDANNETKAAEQRAEEAEQQHLIDAENAEKQRKIDVEAAAQKERDRIEAEKQAEIEAEKKRAANKTHKGKINRTIVKILIDDSRAYDSGEAVLTEKQVKRIVTLIANNKVPNVKISY